ncbi:MAG: lysoplasmalogenase [Rubrivivax sp.]
MTPPAARHATALLLGAGTMIAGALAIAAAPWALGQPWLAFVFKPLATALVIAYAAGRGRATPALRRWLLVGLAASWVGDVALLWPQQGFLPGLIAFLVAHGCYLWAFTRERRLAAWPPAFAAYAVLAGAILAALWPGVPWPLRAPVVVYVVALAAMAAMAAVLWRTGVARGGWFALGGALFVASDALLATERFGGGLPLASLWILPTYWGAQWCLATGLAPAGDPPASPAPSSSAAGGR